MKTCSCASLWLILALLLNNWAEEANDLAVLFWEGTSGRQKCWLQASSLASFLPETL